MRRDDRVHFWQWCLVLGLVVVLGWFVRDVQQATLNHHREECEKIGAQWRASQRKAVREHHGYVTLSDLLALFPEDSRFGDLALRAQYQSCHDAQRQTEK